MPARCEGLLATIVNRRTGCGFAIRRSYDYEQDDKDDDDDDGDDNERVLSNVCAHNVATPVRSYIHTCIHMCIFLGKQSSLAPPPPPAGSFPFSVTGLCQF